MKSSPLQTGGRRLCQAAGKFLPKNICEIVQFKYLSTIKYKEGPTNLYLQISCLVKTTLLMVKEKKRIDTDNSVFNATF